MSWFFMVFYVQEQGDKGQGAQVDQNEEDT